MSIEQKPARDPIEEARKRFESPSKDASRSVTVKLEKEFIEIIEKYRRGRSLKGTVEMLIVKVDDLLRRTSSSK